MRLYDTPDDECMHNVAFVSKSSHHNYELPSHNPRKQTDNKRSRWVLVDVLLIASLLGGCAWFYLTTAAQSSTRDILARLEKAKLEQRTRAEEHPHQHQLHVVEAEEEAVADQTSTSNTLTRPDSIFQNMLHEAKKVQQVEHTNAPTVHERLSATTNQAQRQKLERVRDHHERLQERAAHIRLHNSGGASGQFRTGDIVELYDPNHKWSSNSKWQKHMFAPHQVESSRSYGREVLYDVVCNNDGSKQTLPERFLRLYQPYEAGTEAICNMGSFEVEMVLPCTVQEYISKATRGPEVVHGMYKVRIGPHSMRSDSGYHLPMDRVPVWKIQRLEPTRGTDEL